MKTEVVSDEVQSAQAADEIIAAESGAAAKKAAMDESKRPEHDRLTWLTTEGSPLPLGVTWIEEEQSYNFAVHAEHAESVALLLYSSRRLGKAPPDVPLRFSAEQVRTSLALPDPDWRDW
jgi:hypothetical protein